MLELALGYYRGLHMTFLPYWLYWTLATLAGEILKKGTFLTLSLWQ